MAKRKVAFDADGLGLQYKFGFLDLLCQSNMGTSSVAVALDNMVRQRFSEIEKRARRTGAGGQIEVKLTLRLNIERKDNDTTVFYADSHAVQCIEKPLPKRRVKL